MKTLYLECAMGAAGDMLTAALLELMPDKDVAVAELNAIRHPQRSIQLRDSDPLRYPRHPYVGEGERCGGIRDHA